MKLYHGSQELFEKFDFEYIGKNGTGEGFGIYFSTHKEIAEAYTKDDGYLYEVEVGLGNSINDKEKKFSYEQYEEFLKFIQEETGYLDNFGDIQYEGLEKVLKSVMSATYNYCDSDVEILGGIINASGTVEEVNKLYKEFFDVTHIVEEQPKWGTEKLSHQIYVLLTKEDIEIKKVYEKKNIQ